MAVITHTRYPMVGGLPLATAAHEARGWATVHTLPPLKGSNPNPQGADGRTFRQKNFDAIEFSFDVVTYGNKDNDGNPYSDAHDGLRQNVAQLAAAIDTRDATVEFRDVYATGYRSAQVEVDPRSCDQINPTSVVFVLRFIVVSASWTWNPA